MHKTKQLEFMHQNSDTNGIKNKLLTRDEFRSSVFERDRNKCVFCQQDAIDAHHVLERRLFADGGYYIDNGASVCSEHHLECERTNITVEEVRAACKIKKAILPSHLYHDQKYDKWGNPILPNGMRLRGELFDDESVQKILQHVLNEFTSYVKYPRTYHLPWSPGMNDDDRMMQDLTGFENRQVVVTEKMDGENTTMYRDYIHARSVDSRGHPSRNWSKNFHSQICSDIPEGWRVCVENLYAIHSIHYTDLLSYIYGLSVWTDKNFCLSWKDTKEWFYLLNIPQVPVIYEGVFDRDVIQNLYKNYLSQNELEGYVVRVADSFHYRDFKSSVAKYVRKNHIQTTKHWFHGQPVVANKLKS